MSKIICDVCGTSYPETANQCPICGCVRPADAVTVRGDTNETEVNSAATYTYVKGGRFSKSNVKKRSQGKATPSAAPQAEKPSEKEGKNDKGMIITVLVLLLAIVAIVIYMMARFFLPGLLGNEQDPAQTTESIEQTATTTEATILEIPCVALEVSDTVVEFDKADAALLLNVTPDPVDTTDEITYATSDEKVAVVTKDGKVVAVGSGQATITITCGTATAECRVVCTMEPTPEETTEPTYSTADFKLNRDDFTLSEYGQTHTLYNGEIPVELITWTTDDDKVATVENGVVTAIGSGYTTVYAEYADVKLSCIVRCAAAVKAPADKSEETTEPVVRDYEISHEDVTIAIGEKFTLTLKDKDGKIVDVSWSVARSSICSVSGNTVTGVSKGDTYVSVTINDVTYRCRVIVK